MKRQENSLVEREFLLFIRVVSLSQQKRSHSGQNERARENSHDRLAVTCMPERAAALQPNLHLYPVTGCDRI